MTDDSRQRFEEAFRRWAERPPHTPADEASRRVIARLPQHRGERWLSGSRLHFATAAAGLALLLGFGWSLLPKTQEEPLQEREVALPPLPDDVVLLWLDNETPLYLTIAPSTRKGAS
jgi:hypothetical protein